MTITYEDILDLYGTLNDLGVPDGLSGDRRTLSTTDAISAVMERAFTPDVLDGKGLFNGIVMATLPTTQPTFLSFKDNINYINSIAQNPDGELQELHFIYKVYIPEIDPREIILNTSRKKACEGLSLSQRVTTLPTAVIGSGLSEDKSQQAIVPGTLVDIRFSDAKRFLRPVIVGIGGKVFDVDYTQGKLSVTFANGIAGVNSADRGYRRAKTNYEPVLAKSELRDGPKEGAAFAKRVRKIGENNGYNQWVITSVVNVARKEQPNGGRNYNYYGIMADVGKGWGDAGKYINGSWTGKEGSAGQGVRTTDQRYFASFANEEDGIKFMLQILKGKGFDKATDGDKFLKLYLDKWLSPTEETKQKIYKKEEKTEYRKKQFNESYKLTYDKNISSSSSSENQSQQASTSTSTSQTQSSTMPPEQTNYTPATDPYAPVDPLLVDLNNNGTPDLWE